MSKTAILEYARNIAKAQVNSDRLAIFLEMNKPRKFSKKDLSIALDLPVMAIALALKDQPKIAVASDDPLKYFWGANTKNDKPIGRASINPLCPNCDGKSRSRGKDDFGKSRYCCRICNKTFVGDAAPDAPVSLVSCNDEKYKKLLSRCRHKTFYAVISVRKGMILESVAKKIAKKAFPDTEPLPTTRSLTQNARLLRAKVWRSAISVGDAAITDAIAHLISYLAFPDGED